MTDVAKLKSYLLFMQIRGATGCSQFLTEATTENRVMQSHAGARVCCNQHMLSIFPSPSLGKVWRAWGGRISPELPSPFFPKHQLKFKDTGSPSLADAVETTGDASLGQLRSPSAYSLRVQAALRRAFVLGL